MTEKFKTDEKVAAKKQEEKKKALRLFDSDQVELKKLDADDADDVIGVMKKCAFEVGKDEVLKVINFGLSYGAYVDRMLVGVGLAWAAHYEPELDSIEDGEPNAVYNEDPAILMAYDGAKLKEGLLKKREDEAVLKGLGYSISYLYDKHRLPEMSGIEKKAKKQLEGIYAGENYEFHNTRKGVLVVKHLAIGL